MFGNTGRQVCQWHWKMLTLGWISMNLCWTSWCLLACQRLAAV